MNRVFLNLDTDCSGYTYLNFLYDNKIPVTKESLKPFIEGYKKAGVTDFLINTLCQLAMCKSEVFYDSIDKYNEEYENGIKVNYKENYRGMYNALKEFKINPFEVWIEACKEQGITPWLTMRMNDCHNPLDVTSFIRSDFFYKAREKGWMIGDDYGYHHYCFNYAVKEVYDLMLNFIKEQLFMYDVYGFEMDFMREIYCFPYREMPECYKIMNNFVRDVKKIVDDASVKHGHPIKLGARVTRDIEQNKAFGFDVRTWVNEGLVDVLVPSPRFDTSDTDIPVDVWVKEFPCTEIYAGIEGLIVRPDQKCHNTPDTVRAMIIKYFSMGARGIYLYNYFFADLPNNCELANKIRTTEIIKTSNSFEEAIKHPYRFIVTYQEDWICPKGFTPYKPLPVKLNEAESLIPVSLGFIPENAEVKLFLGIKGDVNNVSLAVDGENISLIKEDPKPSFNMNLNGEVYTYIPKGSVSYSSYIKNNRNASYILSFKAKDTKDNTKITYIEIEVTPK
ncbi:MAG: hypothetical protein E7564_04500 [Ruminococcaceae bacterium]|nr:hypothetical protein [Oscillospiraceae bacterium]